MLHISSTGRFLIHVVFQSVHNLVEMWLDVLSNFKQCGEFGACLQQALRVQLSITAAGEQCGE